MFLIKELNNIFKFINLNILRDNNNNYIDEMCIFYRCPWIRFGF